MLCTCYSKQNCYIFIWSKVVKQNVKCMHFAACNIDQGKSCPASEKDPYTIPGFLTTAMAGFTSGFLYLHSYKSFLLHLVQL